MTDVIQWIMIILAIAFIPVYTIIRAKSERKNLRKRVGRATRSRERELIKERNTIDELAVQIIPYKAFSQAKGTLLPVGWYKPYTGTETIGQIAKLGSATVYDLEGQKIPAYDLPLPALRGAKDRQASRPN